VWRDEIHGTINGIKRSDGAEDAEPMSDDGKGDEGDEQQVDVRDQSSRPSSSSPVRSRIPSSPHSETTDHAPSRPPTRPPSSASELDPFSNGEDDDDLFDLNAVLGQDSSRRNAGTLVASSNPSGSAGDVDEDEMWAMLDDEPPAFANAPAVSSISPSSSRAAGTRFKSAPSSQGPEPAGDDDDMWGMLDELEMGQSNASNVVSATLPNDHIDGVSDTAHQTNEPPPERSTSIPGQIGSGTNDSDWDDMYE